jgi:hypothetical protein
LEKIYKLNIARALISVLALREGHGPAQMTTS